MISAANLSTAQARVMVAALVQLGVRHAVVCPGSRSTAMTLALDARDEVAVHVAIDERSGGFMALGIARVTGVPTPVVTTSGTAVVNLHPAVVEADADGIPLLAITCDRPERLRGTGANQTIDQVNVFGRATRIAVDVPVLPNAAATVDDWAQIIRTGWVAAVGADGSRPGPVQLNLQFDEPTVPETDDGRTVGEPFEHRLDVAVEASPTPDVVVTPPPVPLLAAAAVPRGLLVIGQGVAVDPDVVQATAERLGWPILADPLSGCRALPSTVERGSLLVASDHLRPDAVVRVGRAVLSRPVHAMLGSVDAHVVLDPWGRSLDAGGRVTSVASGDPTALLEQLPANDSDNSWLAAWRTAADAIEAAGHPSGGDGPRIAREVAAALASGDTLVIGSSSPVRDLDEWADIPAGVRVLGNRGASGIDGFVSTAVGVALAGPGRTVALCGDLSFLHDRNGLLADPAGGRPSLTLVVVDNGGGQLFRRLPQVRQPGFERLFVTPPNVDIADVARTHRLDLVEVRDPAGLGAALAREPDAVRLVLVRSS